MTVSELDLAECQPEFQIKVTPKAAHNRITVLPAAATGPGHPAIQVHVTAPPDNNKANKAVIALLAKALDVPKSCLQIKRGATSRLKTIAITR